MKVSVRIDDPHGFSSEKTRCGPMTLSKSGVMQLKEKGTLAEKQSRVRKEVSVR